MRYHLAIAPPNDIVLELLTGARANKVTMEELILDMIEDYLEDCRKTTASAPYAEEPPESGTGPRGTSAGPQGVDLTGLLPPDKTAS